MIVQQCLGTKARDQCDGKQHVNDFIRNTRTIVGVQLTNKFEGKYLLFVSLGRNLPPAFLLRGD